MTVTSAPAARPRGSWAVSALGGLLTTILAMALGHVVAALLNPAASPVLVVGATVIDLTPTPVKEWAVAEFGTADKPLLIGTVVAATLLLAAAAGIVAARWFRSGLVLLMLLVATAGVLALTRPFASPVDVVPAIVTALVAGFTLWWWFHRLPHLLPPTSHPGADSDSDSSDSSDSSDFGQPERSTPPTGPSRRGVLLASGAIAVLATASGAVGQWIATVKTRIGNIALPKPVASDPPLPEGLDVLEGIDGISPFRTPVDDFYRVDINLSVPVVDHNEWTLRVDGDVARPFTIDFDELLAMDMVERDITMTCVSNAVGGEYVGSARWLGVPLVDLLERAEVGRDADQILSTAVDGFTISTPLDVATDGRDALVVVGMNGEPLPREHGFPVRLVIPGLYGFVGSTKWLTQLTLTTYEEQEAYWTERDWATDAPVKISSRIDVPRSGETRSTGEVVIAGVAWAQSSGIGAVEVQIDGGPWTPAELGPDAGTDYWRQWFYRWNSTDQGRHSVTVRAKNNDGETQTDVQMRSFPEGSSGLHTRAITLE